MFTLFTFTFHVQGVDERLGDGIGGRGRLLPSQQRHGVCGKRRERTSLDAPSCPDHPSQRPRYQEPLRDLVRTRGHLQQYAGALTINQSINLFSNIKAAQYDRNH